MICQYKKTNPALQIALKGGIVINIIIRVSQENNLLKKSETQTIKINVLRSTLYITKVPILSAENYSVIIKNQAIYQEPF